MNNLPHGGSPTPPEPPRPVDAGLSSGAPGRERPYWGGIDVVLAICWFVGAMFVASLVTAFVTVIGGGEITSTTVPVYALVFGTLAFQILQATFPWLISRTKGLGLDKDWGFVSRLPQDIFVGFGFAIACMVGAQFVTLGMAALVGLEDSADASNTDILQDNKDSVWIYGLILLVVVGAPLAEELLFRGVILRSLEKARGAIFAVIVSSLLFAVPHYQAGATWQESAVLLSALGTVGLVLGVSAIVTGRLGPAIIAHFFFNGAGTLFTLVFPDLAIVFPY